MFWPVASPALSAPPPLPLPPSPTVLPTAPVLWRDWPRRHLRRHWLQVIRRETVILSWEPSSLREPLPEDGEILLTREQRAHYRLSWLQRLARNARPVDAPRLCVLLHGLPSRFFETFGSQSLAVV